MGTGVFQGIWDELKANPYGRLACSLAFVATFLVYLCTLILPVYPTDLGEYPLGTDVGTFVHGDGRVQQHPISGWLVFGWRGLLTLLGLDGSHPFFVKIPYAILGAVNFLLFAQAFKTLLGGQRAWLYAMCAGFSLTPWFYAASPESYVLTLTFYTGYVLAFLHCTQDATYKNGAIAALFLFLAVVNDVSAPMLAVIPTVYFGLRAMTDKTIRNIAFMHAGAVVAGLLFLIVTTDFFADYISMTRHFSPVKNADSGLVYDHGILEPLLNYLFFCLAAPNAETTYANSLFPTYFGFFQPSLVDYFKSPFGIPFLVLYLAPLWFLRTSGINRILLAFMAFLAVRFVAILFFNPGEAIIYTSVVVLPILAFIFNLMEKSDFKFKTTHATLLFLTIAGSNGTFLF